MRRWKESVAGDRLPLALHLALHLVERLLHRGDIRLFRRLRGERRALALDHIARAEQLEGARLGGHDVASALAVGLRCGAEDVDAGADAHLDQSFDFQRNQRFAHRRPRHAQLLREVALGRQARARGKLSGADQRSNLVGDLAIEPAGLDALERHGAEVGEVVNRRAGPRDARGGRRHCRRLTLARKLVKWYYQFWRREAYNAVEPCRLR